VTVSLPIEVDDSHTLEDTLDPREVEAARKGKSPPICAITNKAIYTHLPFQTVRSILRDKQDRTGIVYPRTEEQTDIISRWMCNYWNPQEPRTISPLEDKIEQYVFKQWEFAICNTFFAVDDLQYRGQLEHEARDYPAHLGYSWHLYKTPQEIYKTAKKVTDTCKVINYDKYKPLVNEQVTIQEIDKCVDELLQQTSIWGNCSLTQLIVLEKYLSLPPEESQTRLLGWNSVVSTIIIKRHRLLTFRYCCVPKINEFHALVVQALLHCRNSEPRVKIQGSWEGTTGSYQGDLQFIPPLPPAKP